VSEADLAAETIRLAEEVISLVKHSQERDWASHKAGTEHGWHIGAGCWVSIGWKLKDAKKAADRVVKLYWQRADESAGEEGRG